SQPRPDERLRRGRCGRHEGHLVGHRHRPDARRYGAADAEEVLVPGPDREAREVPRQRRHRARGALSTDRRGVAKHPVGLGGGRVAVRSEAAFLLGLSGDSDALPPLRAALDDDSARARVEAALAVARLGETEEALPLLRTELRGEFFADAPLRAARALAVLGE